MSYINSNHLKFYIDNFRDLKLVERLVRQCREELPRKVAQTLHKEVLFDLSHQLDDITYCELTDEPAVWWAGEGSYDYNTEKGLYFCLEGLVEGLDTPGESQNAPYVYLYWAKPNSRKGKVLDIGVLRSLIQKFSSTAEMSIIAGPGHLKDENYLALMPLGNILNIDTLNDPKTLATEVKDAALYFTSSLLGLVKQAQI